jgi:hypothetical protein
LVDLVRDCDVREARPEQRDVSGPEEEAEVPMPPERPDVDDGAAEDTADAARNGRLGPKPLGLAAVRLGQTAAPLNCGMISLP